jgi:hypothetical protein
LIIFENYGPDRPGNKVRPYLKNNQSKKSWVWGVTQVAKHLPSKYKALNSTPNTTKDRQTNKKQDKCFIILLRPNRKNLSHGNFFDLNTK